MEIRFLRSAASDIAWMRYYYRSVFPEGSQAARKNYHAARLALTASPHIGHSVEDADGIREYHIPRTPFSFVYRVNRDHIEVIRVLDKRSGEEMRS